IEFTFEHGRLFMLQTRRAQRTGLAAVRTAVEMVDEGLITPDEAVQRVPPQDLDQLFHPMVDPRASVTVVAKGLPASPGAAIGEAVFDADEAETLAKGGRKVILIRPETSPEDFHGIVAAQAVLTARGGMTSHAAVVARGMGKTCVVGAKDIEVDPHAGRFRANGRVVKKGQLITVDGTTGRVILGAAKLVEPKIGEHYAKLMTWADERRRLRVRANADTPQDAKRARELGAEAAAAGWLARGREPDARAPRLPARHHLPRDHGNAGAGHLRGRLPRGGPRPEGRRGGHDPPRGSRGGAQAAGGDRAASGAGGVPRRRARRALPRGNHDRAAARRAHGRRDRQGGGFLLVRHQRPDPDHLRPVAGRRRPV